MPALRNEIFSLPAEFLMKSVRGTTKQNTKAKDNGRKKRAKRDDEEREGACRGRLAEEVPPFKFIYLRVWTLCPWRSTVPLPFPSLRFPHPLDTSLCLSPSPPTRLSWDATPPLSMPNVSRVHDLNLQPRFASCPKRCAWALPFLKRGKGKGGKGQAAWCKIALWLRYSGNWQLWSQRGRIRRS